MPVRSVHTQFEPIAPEPVQTTIIAAARAQTLQRDGLIEKLHMAFRAQPMRQLARALLRAKGCLPHIDREKDQEKRCERIEHAVSVRAADDQDNGPIRIFTAFAAEFVTMPRVMDNQGGRAGD